MQPKKFELTSMDTGKFEFGRRKKIAISGCWLAMVARDARVEKEN